MNAYVISLPENWQKYQRAKQQLEPYGFKVHRWIATDTRKQVDLPARVLNPGAIGCLISHRDLLVHAKKYGHEYLYVFEDDIIVHDTFKVDQPDCDLLYYGASQIMWTDEMKPPMYKANQTLGTFAMRIKHTIFTQLIDALYNTDTTVDNTIANTIQKAFDCRVVFPNMITADVTSSDIRRRLNPTEWERKCRWPRKKKRSFLDNVTFGIVSFNRHMHLEKAVASLPKGAKVIVADNSTVGRPSVPHVALDPDCGASTCRNYIMANCKTDYLMLFDDDTYLQDDVSPFFDFLEREPSYACIGGALRLPDGSLMHSGVRLKDNEMSGAGWQVTDTLVWKPCDMTFDFCMLRVGCGQWDDNIKIGGEHRDFFKRIKGRVAYTPMVKAYHDITGRTPEYMAFRQRRTMPIVTWDQDVYKHHRERPNILVFGVGHSGTTILTKMLMGLGWKNPQADAQYAEDVVVREFNVGLIKGQTGKDPTSCLNALPRPFILKDPRFVVTLEHWYEAFVKFDMLMVYITRNEEDVLDSYLRRNESIDKSHGGHSVQQLMTLAERKYESWPWAKVKIAYEDIGKVARLWKPS